MTEYFYGKRFMLNQRGARVLRIIYDRNCKENISNSVPLYYGDICTAVRQYDGISAVTVVFDNTPNELWQLHNDWITLLPDEFQPR